MTNRKRHSKGGVQYRFLENKYLMLNDQVFLYF